MFHTVFFYLALWGRLINIVESQFFHLFRWFTIAFCPIALLVLRVVVGVRWIKYLANHKTCRKLFASIRVNERNRN
jgi:hypothetical protein